jgi:hypothetical protein
MKKVLNQFLPGHLDDGGSRRLHDTPDKVHNFLQRYNFSGVFKTSFHYMHTQNRVEISSRLKTGFFFHSPYDFSGLTPSKNNRYAAQEEWIWERIFLSKV